MSWAVASTRPSIARSTFVFVAPGARLYSCLADGLPSPQWLAFMATEFSMCLALTFLTGPARRAPAG